MCVRVDQRGGLCVSVEVHQRAALIRIWPPVLCFFCVCLSLCDRLGAVRKQHTLSKRLARLFPEITIIIDGWCVSGQQ